MRGRGYLACFCPQKSSLPHPPKRHSREIDKLTRGSWNKHDATAVRLGFNKISLSKYINFECIHYTQYRNIRNDGFFPVLGLFLKFPVFSLLRFLSLTRLFLKFFKIFTLVSLIFKKKHFNKRFSLLHVFGLMAQQ